MGVAIAYKAPQRLDQLRDSVIVVEFGLGLVGEVLELENPLGVVDAGLLNG